MGPGCKEMSRTEAAIPKPNPMYKSSQLATETGALRAQRGRVLLLPFALGIRCAQPWLPPCSAPAPRARAPCGSVPARSRTGITQGWQQQGPFAPAEVTFLRAVVLSITPCWARRVRETEPSLGVRQEFPLKVRISSWKTVFQGKREQGDGQGAGVEGVSAPESWGRRCLCKP